MQLFKLLISSAKKSSEKMSEEIFFVWGRYVSMMFFEFLTFFCQEKFANVLFSMGQNPQIFPTLSKLLFVFHFPSFIAEKEKKTQKMKIFYVQASFAWLNECCNDEDLWVFVYFCIFLYIFVCFVFIIILTRQQKWRRRTTKLIKHFFLKRLLVCITINFLINLDLLKTCFKEDLNISF